MTTNDPTGGPAPLDDDEMTGFALDLISRECRRQRKEEGWSPDHDDGHVHGELADAAACYAVGSIRDWPWEKRWWKPSGRLRDLEKAGALIVAEYKRILRAQGPRS